MTEEAKITVKLSHYNPDAKIPNAAEELLKRIIAAKDQMLKDNIEANTIMLNGNKYGYLKRPGYTPMLFGMKVETENMPEEYDFMLMNKQNFFMFRSNADRIRSMSDKELAEWIFELLWKYDSECENSSKDWLFWLRGKTE